MESEKITENKSWQLLEKLALASVVEQRRKRRWGIFFKFLGFSYLFIMLLLFAPIYLDNIDYGIDKNEDFVALIEVKGVISADDPASADKVISSLRNAFSSKAKAIIMRINSPGGSPVQSGYIYDEIKRLRAIEDYQDKKVYAVITDIGASGAYYIASAADEIYADKSSLVGSIGVTAAGFGFVDTIEKLGIERRSYTSGKHKSFLDPFQPMKKEETEFWQNVLNVTHQQFIDSVKKGRGDRLKYREHPELFSGLIWSGEQALELGLIDGLASSSELARRLGTENMANFTIRESAIDVFAKKLGTQIASHLALYMGFNQTPVLR